MIGLCGSHRVGKTTLATTYAENIKIPFVSASATPVFEALGYDPKVDYDFKTRLMIQNEILTSSEKLWGSQVGEFITDRTPIDMLAYTMADIQRANLDKAEEQSFLDYQQRCYDAANRYFSLLVAIQPGIPVDEVAGKGPANMAYIEHINTLILGIVNDSRSKNRRFIMSRRTTDLAARCIKIDEAYERAIGGHFKEMMDGAVTLH